ncbi:forkhead domain-containing protein [Encephalitozoon hellem]|uniref:Forkhead domain-containing protein n=1 Tax=Encephalitozoon hellem TaxID=27973 RepID=A0A9Q9C1H7_ENCHE|nr:forkhead/HNF3 transcription factor [Encephalitozoon hellem ATCC 50504]AFM97657.1 forkhead/HNF3 transcription factor [Encephalitozoon hellem ATCC 50504]KAG5858875.1 forkhead domain-containing protein [Encephalitozoon hellem]UTX42346.1 forkhead domain-containing protein [Encephalitozoon hellem]WEL37788.1 forkhead domain-containing protein [Encephalitozoon hellem]|eukprot:XP_003886638.1 forkhead/HNF3 transcription factor [Encephalitozoon hellem ATCC 50504]
MFGKEKCGNEDGLLRCNDNERKGLGYSSDLDAQDQGKRGRRPGISYADLITEAIESSSEGMLTLKEIYSYISSKHPYFSLKKTGWQNSIRHNLSLNKSFYKVPRTAVNPGKGSFWKINYEFQNNKGSQKTYRSRNKYSFNSHRDAEKNVNSISELLGAQQGFFDNIGVTEVPFERHTTIFDGNLTSLSDCLEHNYQKEYFDHNDDISNANYIFSFR